MAEKFKNNMTKDNKKKYWIIFFILAMLLLCSLFISLVLDLGSDTELTNYNTAIIPIKGVISTADSSGFLAEDTVSSSDIIEQIEKAKNDPNVKAIIFEINSPGGSPVATDEITEEIKSLKDNNITVVAWIREVGASGAYWISTASEHIVANRMSIVGSIGVIGSYIEWYGLMNKYNVTYKRLVSGEFKDSGTPYRPLSSAEEIMIQDKLDVLHRYFIEEVSNNRNMSIDNVTKLASGEIFLGVEAKASGLIDETGGKAEAIKYIENKRGIKVIAKEFAKQKSFIENLMSAINKNSFFMGEGMASWMTKDSGLKITT
jgi:protease IV